MFRIESVQFKINWVIELSFVKMSLSVKLHSLTYFNDFYIIKEYSLCIVLSGYKTLHLFKTLRTYNSVLTHIKLPLGHIFSESLRSTLVERVFIGGAINPLM